MPLDDNAQYWIARGSETFGPYTGAQVRAYVAGGNISPSDQIRADTEQTWVPVAVALASGPAAHGLPPSLPSFNPPHAAQEDPAKTFAILSLVLGVLGLICCGIITAIPGLIFGIIAMQRSGPSRGLALAGVIVSGLALLFGILGLCVFFIFPQFLPPIFNNPNWPSP